MKAIKNWVLSITSPSRKDETTTMISPRQSVGSTSSYGSMSAFSMGSLNVKLDADMPNITEIFDAEIDDHNFTISEAINEVELDNHESSDRDVEMELEKLYLQLRELERIKSDASGMYEDNMVEEERQDLITGLKS